MSQKIIWELLTICSFAFVLPSTINGQSILEDIPPESKKLIEQYNITGEIDRLPNVFEIKRIWETKASMMDLDTLGNPKRKLSNKILKIIFQVKSDIDSVDRIRITNFDIVDKAHVVINISKSKYIRDIDIKNTKIDAIHIDSSEIELLNIKDSYINSFSIRESKINKGSYISNVNGKSFSINNSDVNSLSLWNINSWYYSTITKNIIGGSRTSISMKSETKFPLRFYDNTVNSRITFKGNETSIYPFDRYFHKNQFFNDVIFEGIKKNEKKDTVIVFHDLEFHGKVFFKGSLPSNLLLIDISSEEDIDFTWVDHDTYCHIDLNMTDIDKIKLDYNNFRISRLISNLGPMDLNKLDEKEYKNREIERLEVVFTKLLAKQEKENFGDSYKKLDLHYKGYKYFRYGRINIWDGIYYIVAKAWWNFGYSKQRIFIWTALFFSLFCTINYFNFNTLINRVYSIEKINTLYKKLNKKDLPAKKHRHEKIKLVVHYTIFVFFGFSLNHENLSFESFKWTIYIYSTYTIGLICIAFILNYILFLNT